jgi:acyl-coenzyme A thioesterase PaaI-like protein
LIATPIHVGRTTIVVQTDITNEKDDFISRTIQTQAVISNI